MKTKWLTVLLLAVLLAGVTLLLYPGFSAYWNSLHATKTIAAYAQTLEDLTDSERSALWEAAEAYNAALRTSSQQRSLSDAEQSTYESLLNLGGTGMMGYVEIPSISVSLPIYHGTSDGVLQVAAGHLEWSSLPVGGAGTHCVISGHRGLPRAKLFTDLDQLHEGENFMLHVLDETLTYEIDQIRIVEPQNTEDLCIVSGRDYCTLLTCTPYGINTHRLLVRGHRVTTPENVTGAHAVSEAVQIEPLLVASLLAVPLFVCLLLFLKLCNRRRR